MKKSRAVFTMVFNEPVFLPLWLRYYSRFFAPEDTYVLDHGSTDGSTERTGFVRRMLLDPVVDCTRQLETVTAMQHELIDQYETVLYTDVDEIVAPDPRTGTLGDYIDKFGRDYVTCCGFDLLHKREEPPLDLSQPIFSQRHYWFPNSFSCKPVLARVKMEWGLGCHTVVNKPVQKDSLHLIHLHRMDYGICLNRHRNLEAVREPSPADKVQGFGVHRFITATEDFDKWFYTNEKANEAVPIPDYWRELSI